MKKMFTRAALSIAVFLITMVTDWFPAILALIGIGLIGFAYQYFPWPVAAIITAIVIGGSVFVFILYFKINFKAKEHYRRWMNK